MNAPVFELTDIESVVSLVWSTTLDLEAEPIPVDPAADWTRPAIEAQVHITGGWRGAVVVHASPALAATVARKMFRLGDRTPRSDDILDALGEIANITGGNIKGLLSAGETHLSLPAVVQGASYSVSVPGSRQILRAVFSCEREPMVVTILEATR